MSEADKLTPPTDKTRGDYVQAVVRAAAGAIPLVGGAVVELVGLVTPPLERRRQRWMQEIADAITQIAQTTPHTFRGLEEDDAFLSAFAQALPAAIRTHQEEKLRALRNAVVNTAIGTGGLSHDLPTTFIRFVDEMTPAHLRLLKAMLDHEDELHEVRSYKEMLATLGGTPMWADDFRLLCQDLQSRTLIRISTAVEEFDDVFREELVTSQTGPPSGRPRFRVTRIGKLFLRFVADPDVPDATRDPVGGTRT
jgi:hypothetical protein